MDPPRGESCLDWKFSGPCLCVGCCCGGFGLVMFILFFCLTLVEMPHLHYGLARNKITGRVNLDRVHLPGRYWIGFWSEFMLFPSYLSTIEFSDETPEEGVKSLSKLMARDQEGRLLLLDISIQYRLIADEIGQMYKEFTTNYEDMFISELRQSLTRGCTRFTAEDVWNNYTYVNDLLFEECKEAIRPRHAECWGLQVWGVRLNDRAEAKVVQTQVTKQAQNTGLAKKGWAEVRANTSVILSVYHANITFIEAQGVRQSAIIEAEAQANATGRLIRAQAESLEIAREVCATQRTGGELLAMSAEQISRYDQLQMLHRTKDAHMVYHLHTRDAATTATTTTTTTTTAGRRLLNSSQRLVRGSEATVAHQEAAVEESEMEL